MGFAAKTVGPVAVVVAAVETVASIAADTLDSAAAAVAGMVDSAAVGMAGSSAGPDNPAAAEDAGLGLAYPACYYQRPD